MCCLHQVSWKLCKDLHTKIIYFYFLLFTSNKKNPTCSPPENGETFIYLKILGCKIKSNSLKWIESKSVFNKTMHNDFVCIFTVRKPNCDLPWKCQCATFHSKHMAIDVSLQNINWLPANKNVSMYPVYIKEKTSVVPVSSIQCFCLPFRRASR